MVAYASASKLPTQGDRSGELLELAVLAEVELHQVHLLGGELVDGGHQLQVVLEVIVIVVVFDPEVHHLLQDVPQALIVELLLVKGLFLLLDFLLQDRILLEVKSLSLFLQVLLVVYLNSPKDTVFSCSVFSFMREVIIHSFSYMMRFNWTNS